MSKPSSTTEAIGRWEELSGDVDRHRFTVGDGERRRALIGGLRELADFLEIRPEIPVTRGSVHLYTFASGTQDQRRAQVDYASELANVPVEGQEGHHEIELGFGPVHYFFISMPDEKPSESRSFADGDEVVLIGAPAEHRRGMWPLAGTAMAYDDDRYVVEFVGPEEASVFRAADLEPAPPLTGIRAKTLESVQTEYTVAAGSDRARQALGLPFPQARAQEAAELLTALSQVCELPPERLRELLDPAVEEVSQLLQQTWTRASSQAPATLAALDQPAWTGPPSDDPPPTALSRAAKQPRPTNPGGPHERRPGPDQPAPRPSATSRTAP